MSIKVSIIMSVYKESIDQLKRSIDSILHQSFQDFEFIIILDNPENIDAENYIIDRGSNDSRIIFLKNKENIKSGPCINKGVKISQGKYIALMDGDDSCHTSRLYKQYEHLKSHDHVDIVFTGWEQIDEDGNTETRIPNRKEFKNIQKTFFYKSPLLHASLMCKKSILVENKYSDYDRPADFELFLGFIHSKIVFDVIEENLYSYYIDGQNLRRKYEKIRVFSSNFLKILFKNIAKFWSNIYFWWMFLIVIIQWILSRNYTIFCIFFTGLQRVYKQLFL